MTPAETTRQIRAMLKRAWPQTKFLVRTTGQIVITWTDDGPEESAMQDVLLRADFIAVVPRTWDDKIRLRVNDDLTIYLDRYNAAERAAKAQHHEEIRQKRQRQDRCVSQAKQLKHEASAITPVGFLDTNTRATASTAQETFEALRQRVEADVARGFKHDRRPTWAPPLIIEGELLELCHRLEYLAADDKPIARLWATFADPKSVGTYLRENISKHALDGIYCRGFQLYVGAEKSGSPLFEAQWWTDGWRFGPRLRLHGYHNSDRESRWEKLFRERLLEQESNHSIRVQELTEQIAALDVEDLKLAEAFNQRQQQRARAIASARLRVLDFLGAPDAQMQLAARLSGHCCVCFKELTDPISLERGIGPDCYQHEIEAVNSAAGELRSNGQQINPESIAQLTRQPVAFITAVLQQQGELVG